MRAVVGYEFGGIESLALQDVDRPVLVDGAVRIAVHAAGVSYANLLVAQGKHQNRPSLPFTPGTEVAGVVIETAFDASGGFRPGDRVCAGLPSGGFAEEAIVSSRNVFRIPDRMPFEQATHFSTIYATAFAAVNWKASLAPGEVLLVHGAGGASGLAAVEIGAAFGACVIATAGSAEKVAAAIEHGASHGINYRKDDIRDTVLRLTEGRGADVVFDPVGGDMFDVSLRCMAPLGRLLTIGFASGRIPQIPANILLVKNLSVIGIYWGFYMGWGKTQADKATRARVQTLFDELFTLYEQGRLRPVVEAVMPLSQFAKALRCVEDRKVIGKIVLQPGH